MPTPLPLFTRYFSLAVCLLLLACSSASGQSRMNRDVRAFTNFYQDGTLVGSLYGEALFQFGDFDFANLTTLGARVGFPIGASFELGTELFFLNLDPEFGDNLSGVSDLGVYGRYRLNTTGPSITVGGSITLPVGEENLGQERVNLGTFGAIRHAASPDLTLLGTLGIEFLEFDDDYEASLRLGGGLVYQTNGALHVLGELTILSESDFVLLSGGIDYPLPNGGSRLRAALGVGLDDGAPDLQLILALLFM